MRAAARVAPVMHYVQARGSAPGGVQLADGECVDDD